MTIEDIKQEATNQLNNMEDHAQEFMTTLERISTGNGSIGELDEVYRKIKVPTKELNKLAKKFDKLLKEKEDASNHS
jgi:coenzyme F420-reducing hydrogenase delta subunit